MNKPAVIVTLLTDFGTRDGYAAAMKGVLLGLAPHALMVDASHDIPRHDIQAGAWALRQYTPHFPEGTIHVAVVDPGVGSSRAALLVEAHQHVFLAPDNGLLCWVVEGDPGAKFRKLRDDVHRPGTISATFHGRDIFAHAAGLLASGSRSMDDLSIEVKEIVRPPWVTSSIVDSHILGEIVHVDGFGNLITNIPRSQVEEAGWNNVRILAGSTMLYRLYATYSDVPSGTPLALIGSSENLEIAVNGGSAEQMLGLKRGMKVAVEKSG